MASDFISVTDKQSPADSASTFLNIVMHYVEHSEINLRTLKPWINENLIKAIQNREKLSKQMRKQPFDLQMEQYLYYYRHWLNKTN